MKKYFPGYDDEQLKEMGAFHTAMEISGQPQLWLKTWLYLYNVRHELNQFLAPLIHQENLQVIFTGAGTSAYIGDVLEGVFLKKLSVPARAVATTDIVTHPEHYFLPHTPTLLVSFARSGNSPESIKAIRLADEIGSQIFHLIITCNPKGALAKEASQANRFVFILPPEANDQSLAMTGSFSSMLLAGILISRFNELEELKESVRILADYGVKILRKYMPPLFQAAQLPFKRAVFLGSGIFQGIARESHLKLQELTDGQVICKFDTFLGFRHGPKAVIDAETLMFYIFSNQSYVQKYELDLLADVNKGEKGILSIALMEHELPEVETDVKLVLTDRMANLEECFLAPAYILPAQMLGFYKSLNLNLKPDNPSESGTITRVVQGVKLYPFSKQDAESK